MFARSSSIHQRSHAPHHQQPIGIEGGVFQEGVACCDGPVDNVWELRLLGLMFRGDIDQKWFAQAQAARIAAKYGPTGVRGVGGRGQAGALGDQTVRRSVSESTFVPGLSYVNVCE